MWKIIFALGVYTVALTLAAPLNDLSRDASVEGNEINPIYDNVLKKVADGSKASSNSSSHSSLIDRIRNRLRKSTTTKTTLAPSTLAPTTVPGTTLPAATTTTVSPVLQDIIAQIEANNQKIAAFETKLATLTNAVDASSNSVGLMIVQLELMSDRLVSINDELTKLAAAP